MNLIGWSIDKYVGFRLEGLDPESAFVNTKLSMHRFVAELLYHSGEALGDSLFSEISYILDDYRFTQQAENVYLVSRPKLKIPAAV